MGFYILFKHFSYAIHIQPFLGSDFDVISVNFNQLYFMGPLL
jgi:hypothetical protein